VIQRDFRDGHDGAGIHAHHGNHLESKVKKLKSSGDESMKAQQIQLDLSGMPPHAKIELLDFYEFLRQKYGGEQTAASPKPRTRKKAFQTFLSNTVPVEKITRFSRDDLHERG
jgi:hypothetical protein